jgi:hypothetical protein
VPLRIFLFMWTPALASFVARLAAGDGFGDLSFRWRGPAVRRAMAWAIAFPLGVGALAYGGAWATGLASFDPPTDVVLLDLPSWVVPVTGPPLLRFGVQLAVYLTIGSLAGCVWTAGDDVARAGLEPRAAYTFIVRGMLEVFRAAFGGSDSAATAKAQVILNLCVGEKRASVRTYAIHELVALIERAGLRFVSLHAGCSTAPFRLEGPTLGGRVAILARRDAAR